MWEVREEAQAAGEREEEEDLGSGCHFIVPTLLRHISSQWSQLPGHTAGTAPELTADFL